jgi:hypothetical protein
MQDHAQARLALRYGRREKFSFGRKGAISPAPFRHVVVSERKSYFLCAYQNSPTFRAIFKGEVALLFRAVPVSNAVSNVDRINPTTAKGDATFRI